MSILIGRIQNGSFVFTEGDESVLKLSGVYKITCENTGMSYYGSSAQKKGFRARFRNHVARLRKGVHNSKTMQRDWKRYGESALIFEIIEICERSECIVREQAYLDVYGVGEKNRSYNNSPTAGSPLGVKHTEETVRKRSEQKKAWAQTPSGKLKLMQLAQLRRGNSLSPEHRQKISEAAKNRKLTEERKNKFLACGQQACKKHYIVTSPDGSTFAIHGLAQFCRENGLSASTMGSVAQGKRSHHKGWTCKYVD